MIREMTPADIPEVVRIESSSFSDPWPLEVLESALLQRSTAALVYDSGKEILGYVIVHLKPREIRIANLAVQKDHRRQGIALACLGHVEGLGRRREASRIILEVQETNLAAQLLYRKAGYRATKVLKNYYPAVGEDGYEMVRALQEVAPAPAPV